MPEYIEREAVLNESIEVYHWNGWEDRYDDFVPTEAIRAVPAADVVAVKHSRWDTIFFQRLETELASYTHICPECKYLYRDLHMKGHNYCPNCGAIMDGGKDNAN